MGEGGQIELAGAYYKYMDDETTKRVLSAYYGSLSCSRRETRWTPGVVRH